MVRPPQKHSSKTLSPADAEVADTGFVDGVSRVSERRWKRLKRAALPQGPFYIKLKDGSFKEVELPSLDGYTEDGRIQARVLQGSLLLEGRRQLPPSERL